MKIEMSGYAYVRADVRTVEDLRTLLRFLDDNKVIDAAELDWGSEYVYVSVVEDAKAEFTECGDHIPPSLKFDVILNTHQHQIPETYEEALELRLEHPARFDRPAIDKYGDLSRPE